MECSSRWLDKHVVLVRVKVLLINQDVEHLRELLEFADDCIYIPDLMDYLKKYNDVFLCGGGLEECLKEVEIALLALEKPFNILSEFTY